MDDEHLDGKTLNQFLDGALDRAANRSVVRHLLTGCEKCFRLARGLTSVHPVFSDTSRLSPSSLTVVPLSPAALKG